MSCAKNSGDEPNYSLKEICSQFDIKTDIEPYGNGHINDTYLCETAPRFILQRMNTNVFKDPAGVMENIVNVTAYLADKIKAAGGDPSRETMTVIKTVDNENYYKADENNYFRMYTYIENSVSIDVAEDSETLRRAGAAFGRFQKMLSDFPAETLHETIPDFHNTPQRVNQLEEAVKNNAAGRLDSVEKELDFAMKYSVYASRITDEMEKGKVPLRVTHNDTKLNNVLFDAETGDGLCVIDLDTVMPGSVLFDFGDALRFGASSGSEDETDLDKIWFDLDKFEGFAKGFLSETAECLTETEIKLLPLSALLMTYECGIRFLADYLNGDTYFKIHYPKHNLDRARTQFKLVHDMENKLSEMAEIVSKYIK